MKLRLPHKFQAALLAALASVSFTTLSSGTLTVAAGAALLASQQAQAEDIVLTNVMNTGGNMAVTTDVWGDTGVISTASASYSITAGSGNPSATNYTNSFLATRTNVGSGTPGGSYTYTLTFKTAESLANPVSLSSINVDFITFNGSGQGHNQGAPDYNKINCTWTLTETTGGTLQNVSLPDNGFATKTSAAYTHDTDGTYTTNNFSGATTNIDFTDFALKDDTTYTLTLAVSKAGGANGFFVGIGNIAFLYTPETFDYTWAATTAGTDWMADNAWTKDGKGATFTANSNATFGSGAATEVGISSAVSANTVTVSGQNYTFNLSGSNASLTANALTVESGLSITGTGTVTAGSLSLAGGAGVDVGAGSSLTITGTLNNFSGKVTGDGALHLSLNTDPTVDGIITLTEGSDIKDIYLDSGCFAINLNNSAPTSNLRGANLHLNNQTFVVRNGAGAGTFGSGDTVMLTGNNTLRVYGSVGGTTVLATNFIQETGKTATLQHTDGGTITMSGTIDLDQWKSAAGTTVFTGTVRLNHLYGGGGSTTLGNGNVTTTGQLRLSEQGVGNLTVETGAVLNITGSENGQSTGASILLAHWGQNSTLTLNGGTINAEQADVNLSWDGTGTFAANSGTAYVKGIDGLANGGNRRGTFSLGTADSGSATVVLGSTGLKDMGGSVVLNLGQGTLGASANWTLSTSGGGAVNANFIGTGTGTIINTSTYTITFDNGTTGSGNVTVAGTGKLVLNGGGNRTGATTVQGGATLEVHNASALGTGAVTVDAGGTLDLQSAVTLGSLTLAEGVNDADGGILKFFSNSAPMTLSGNLTLGAGSVFDLANIQYSAAGVTLATVGGTITGWEGVKLENDPGLSMYGASSLTVSGNTLTLTFAQPDTLLVWDAEGAFPGVWGTGEFYQNWHEAKTPDVHVDYPGDRAVSVRFTQAEETAAMLVQDIAVDTLNIDSGATANIDTNSGGNAKALQVASVEGAGATLSLTGEGSTTVSGETVLDTLTVAGGSAALNGTATITALNAKGGEISFGSDATIGAVNVISGESTITGLGTITTLNATSGTATFNGTSAVTTLNVQGNGTSILQGTGAVTTLNATGGTTTLDAGTAVTTLNATSGTNTVNGAISVTTLNATGGTIAIHGTGAQNKASVGTVNVAQGATAEFTYTDFNFTSTDRAIKGNVTIGEGATGTVSDKSDGLNYDGTVTITVDGGTLVMNNRWTVGGNNKIVLNNGTVTGTGQSGASAFDPIGNNNFIVSTGTSSIAAPIRLRNAAVGIDVQSGTLTISGNMTELGGAQGLVKNGAGTLALTGTLNYTGTTKVSAGTLTVGGAYSLNNANQLQVTGGTATFNGAVTIGANGTFSVADGAHLNFTNTVAVTRNELSYRDNPRTREQDNGFGDTVTYVNMGAGVGGSATWTLNGTNATYNDTTGELGFSNATTTYYIFNAVDNISDVLSLNPHRLIVDLAAQDAVQALGDTELSGLNELVVKNGIASTTHAHATGVVKLGSIIINGGGTFRVAGNHDAFGWGDSRTGKIVLNGTDAEHLAVLDLRQTSGGSVTMATDLELNGYTRIANTGAQKKGFNTYGGSITATGTDNIIDHMRLRDGVTVTVNPDATLRVKELVSDDAGNGGNRNFTKAGAGELTVDTCTATFNNLTVSGGSMTTTAGNFVINNEFNVTGEGTEVTFGGKVTMKRNDRNNFNASGSVVTFNGGLDFTGNGGSGQYALTVASGATLKFGGTSTVRSEGGTLLGIGQAGGSTVELLDNATLTLGNLYNSGTLSGNGAVKLGNGATLNVGILRSTNLTNAGTINATGEVKVAAISGTGTINTTGEFVYDSDSNSTYAGDISASKINKNGTGALVLSGNNTMTGEALLYKGTLEVTQLAALGGQGVNTSGGTVTRFNLDADHSGVYGGVVRAGGSVEKTGAGTLTLTGDNIYSGTTTVNGGTLAPAGKTALASNITVNSGATLKLSAKPVAVTTGSVTVADGANLSISAVNGTRARSGASFTAATANGGFTIAPGATVTLGGAYTGTVAADTADSTKLVVSNVTQTGSIYHLYLLTGQSNSLGAVKDSPLNATMLAAYQAAGVQMYNANITSYSNKDNMRNAVDNPHWEQLAPQEPGKTVQASAYYNNPCMGPEYGFAYMMQKNGWFTTEAYENQDKLGVILASLDGGGNKYWVKDSDTGYTYDNILAHVKDALLEAKDQGCSAVSLDGLMYLQGETNDGTEAAQAATRYADFIANLRVDLETWMVEENITGIDLVFNNNTVTGEPRLGNGNRTTTANNLLTAATSNGLVNADMNGLGHVLTNDLAVTNCDGQNVHYTGDSQLTIGARYAYAFAVQNGIDVGAVRGQDDSKKLNEAGAWWMEKLPGENEVATWDISSVGTANEIATDETLTVGGIKIDEVYHNGATDLGQGSVAITGGTLSLGEHGIVLAGGNLSIGSAVDVRASQTWDMGSHTLTTGGTVTIAEGQILDIGEGAHYNFNVIEGSGSLVIGSNAVLGMTELDLQHHTGEIGYSDGDNGYFSGEAVLVDLAGSGTVTLGTGVTGADALDGSTIKVKDDDNSILLASVVSNGHYQVRSGTVTYSTAKDIDQATLIAINDMGTTGATLALDSSWAGTTPIVVEGNGGTISIGTGMVLAQASLQTVDAPLTLTGSGTFVMNAKSGNVSWPMPTNVSLAQGADGWKGIVRISGGNFQANNLDALANGMYSTVELNGVSGWTSHSTDTLALNLMLTDKEDGTAAWDFNAGSSNGDYDNPKMTITGKVSGTGTLKKTNDNHESFAFSGDISEWTGKYLLTVGRKTRLTFLGDAHEVNIDTEKTNANGQISIAVGDGNAAFSTKFTEQSDMQGVNEILVRANATAEFAGSIAASGASTFNGTVTNSGTMTLNGLTMAEGATFTNTGSLTLNGAITFGATGIANNGESAAVTLSSANTFNLSHLTADENGVYTLFTTNSESYVDLSGFHYSAANITGVDDKDSKVWIFGNDGTITGRTASDLAWAGTDGNNIWTTNTETKNWSTYGLEDERYFAQGDKVTFSGTTGDAITAVLGTDIIAGKMTMGVAGGGSATLTVQNGEDGHYSLQADELVLNGTSSLTVKGDADNKSYFAKMTSADGSTLTLENAEAHLKDGNQSYAGSLTIGEGATVLVDATDSLKYSGTRTITVKEGGTLQFNGKRWTVGGSTTIDMQGGLITGTGDSTAALDLLDSSVMLNATAGSSRIEVPIQLRSDSTFTVAEGASLEIAGQLKQDGSNRKLTKNGAGTLKFSYTSGNVNQMLINQGALEVYSTLPTINILDFSDNNRATGTLTVKDGGTVTTNQLWLADHTVVTLEQGGKLYTEGMLFNGIAPAEDGQKSILHWIGDPTDTGNRFYTTTAGFELLHGDLTTNGANKTISMRLTDSTLHVGHNTTVNNAANTITETTLNAGNLTVGADMQLGDVVMNGGNMTVNANTNPTVGAITVNGGKNGTITNNGIISLTGAMTVNGNLTLAGSGEYDLSNMEFIGDAHYTGGEHEQGEEKYNGFAFTLGYVNLATISESGSITGADTANFTYNHIKGDYNGGVVSFEDADWTNFYINRGSESVSYAKAQAEELRETLRSVSLANGTTLTVDDNISSSLVNVISGRGTLDIQEGYTVTSDGQGRNITLNGNGTYKLQDTVRSLESGVQLGDADHWTGSVEISGDVAGNHVFQNLSNASSFVKLNGVDTWISPNGTVAANLILEGKDDGTAAQHSGAGLNIHGADNNKSYTFTGIIKGSGDIAFTQRDHAARSSVFVFTGDLTNWTGDFVNYDGDNGTHPSLRYLTAGDAVIGSGIKQLIFSDKSTSVLDVTYGGENTTSVTVNGNISKAEGSVLNITAAKSTSFNGSLDATSLTLAAGADLALAGETTIGTLTMANGDTLTVAAEGHAVALSNVSGISETIELTAGTLSFGGTVDITGMSPSGEPEREFVDGMVVGSGNGFLSQSAVYQLVNVGQDVTFDASLSSTARFLYDGAEGTLNDDGEVVLSASTSYLTYYVNNAVAEDANVDTLSHAITTAAAQDPAVTLAGVEMKAAGTRLAVDTTASLDTLAVTAGEGSASLINGGEGEHTLTVTNLTAGGKLNVGEGVTLNLATALSGDALNLANLANAGGTVNVALGSDSVLTMDEASTGTLQVRSGELSYRSTLGSQTVKLDAGTKLLFGSTAVQGSTDAAEFNHDIVLGGNAEVKVYGNSFHSSSTINGNISGAYTLTKSDVGNLDVNGTVSVASLTIGGTDSTVNFNKAVQLTGTLTVNGGATANFKSDADMSLTTVSISGNNTHASFNGHVTASGNPITVGGATGLSVAFNDGISYTGTGGQYGYALTVGANSTVTLGGTTEVEKFIGPATNATLVVDEGASVTAPGIFNSRTLSSNGTLNVLSKASVTTTSEFYMMTVNNAGDMTLGGSTAQIDTLNATGGSLTLTATNSLIKTGLTLGAEAGLEVAAGALTISGDSTLHNTISNSGTLTFSGGVGITMDASMVQDGAVGYLDTDDDFTSDGNGFSTTRTGKFVTVATGPGSVVASNIAVTAGDGKYYLNNRGVAFAVDAVETVTYDTYYQKSGVADLSDIIAKAGGSTVYTVQVGANTQLNLNGYVETVNSIGGSGVQDCAIINLQDGAKVSDVVTQATMTAVVGDLNINGTDTPDLQGAAAQLHMNSGNTLAVVGDVNVDNKVRFVKAGDEGLVQVTSIASQTGAQYTLDKATMMVASDKVQKVAEGNVEVANYTSSRVVDNKEASGSFTLSNASLAMQALEEVHAVTGDIAFLNTGNQYEPTLQALEIADGKTVSFNQAGSIEAMATETNVTVTGTLTAGQGAKLNANLVMEEGSVLDVSASNGVNGLLMGSSVTLKLGETLSETTLAQLPTQLYTKYDLYSDVDTFFLEGFERAQAAAPLEYTAWVDAHDYYTNVTANEYFICYSGAGTAGGNGGNVGTVYLYRVPEPATSTLSLLALAALAARRRRK